MMTKTAEWNAKLAKRVKAELEGMREGASLPIDFEEYAGGIEDMLDACKDAGLNAQWRGDGLIRVSL